jgi:hypothetical protein
MSLGHDSDRVGERRALMLIADPAPCNATRPTPAPDRQTLEDEHTPILARAVGDHRPYELALRANKLAAQLQQTA